MIAYVKEAHEKGVPLPSLREIKREFGISNRKFYELFPNGLREVYEGAGVPENRIRERLATVEEALKSKRTSVLRENELKARIFEELESGKSLAKIVIDLKADPKVVKEAFEDWRALKEVDVNQPVVLRGLKELEELVKATFDVGRCKNCGQRYLRPKFLDAWICPCCSQTWWWNVDYIKKIRPLTPKGYKLKRIFY